MPKNGFAAFFVLTLAFAAVVGGGMVYESLYFVLCEPYSQGVGVYCIELHRENVFP
jgi:hypothetical protein